MATKRKAPKGPAKKVPSVEIDKLEICDRGKSRLFELFPSGFIPLTAAAVRKIVGAGLDPADGVFSASLGDGFLHEFHYGKENEAILARKEAALDKIGEEWRRKRNAINKQFDLEQGMLMMRTLRRKATERPAARG